MNIKINSQPLLTYENSDELGCLIWTLPFIGFSIWAFLNDKTLWMTIGIVITYIIVKLIYDSYSDSKHFNNWIHSNTGTVILFYPTSKHKQTEIKEKIGIHIDKSIKQMSYDQSKIRGDIKYEQFIKKGLGQLNRLYPNHPRLIQISGNSLIELINLDELNRINKLEESRLNDIIREINTYA